MELGLCVSSTMSEMSANYGSGATKGLFLIVKVGPEIFMVEEILNLGEGCLKSSDLGLKRNISGVADQKWYMRGV